MNDGPMMQRPSISLPDYRDVIEAPVVSERIGDRQRWRVRQTGRIVWPQVLTVGGLVLYATIMPMFGLAQFDNSVLAAVFLASLLSSIAGFAFSAICGALLLHLISGSVQIVELMVVCSIAIQSLSVWSLRRSIWWQDLAAFLIGGALGLVPGVYLLFHLPQTIFATSLGVFLVLYATFMVFRRPMHILRNFGAMGDGTAGFVGGITGGLMGFPGALVTIWCSLKGWDKRQQRGVYQPFILVMQVLTLAAIHFIRPSALMTLAQEIDTLAYVPAALVGTWFGLQVFDRLSDRQFALAINLLLLVSGAAMLLK